MYTDQPNLILAASLPILSGQLELLTDELGYWVSKRGTVDSKTEAYTRYCKVILRVVEEERRTKAQIARIDTRLAGRINKRGHGWFGLGR